MCDLGGFLERTGTRFERVESLPRTWTVVFHFLVARIYLNVLESRSIPLVGTTPRSRIVLYPIRSRPAFSQPRATILST
jgi:hypothetical protein